MKKLLLALITLTVPFTISGQKIEYSIDKLNGSLQEITIQNDTSGMNWILRTDGSQYGWINEEHGWGLGELTIVCDGTEQRRKWHDAKKIDVKGEAMSVLYDLREAEVIITRRIIKNDLVEEIEFRNKTNWTLQLKDIAINTPFNDNYPDAETCYHSRANAHIWAGYSNAYINAMRMGGYAPHLGLVLTEGTIKSYEIRERSRRKGLSNVRGVIVLNPEDFSLQPGGSHTLSWTVFSHSGQNDFYQKLLHYDSVTGRSEKYVYEKGETAKVEFEYNGSIGAHSVFAGGKQIKSTVSGNKIIAEYQSDTLGDLIFRLNYGNGKSTYIQCLVVSGIDELIDKRVHFIIDKQQFHSDTDFRDGAYLVYDNESGRMYLNDENRSDCDEGRERVGMGVLLALRYQQTKDEKIKQSLFRYYSFLRTLQRDDYTTFSNAAHTSKDRAYNYPWMANFYFEMFNVTGDKKFLNDGYQTMKAMYRRHGHNFYAIDTPVKGYELLKNNGFKKEAESLLEDFKKNADTYLANGRRYPKSEVNYEQSIVGPSIVHMLRVYLITGEQKYLDGAKELMPLLESFGGFQPSYFMNEIAIRHWDGYWFGKYRLWGDTFVHYWSTITASAYNLYYRCTGDISYQKRAENIVRNNLCLFFEDGSASCAFVYPDKVNGENAHLFDPYANDQDWALVFYYYVNNNL